MSKRVRTLILSGVAVAVLLGALGGLLLFPDTDGQGTTTTTVPSPAVTLIQKESAAVAAAISNDNGTFSLKKDSNGLTTVVGQEDLPHSSFAVVNLMDSLKKIEAQRLIAEAPATPQTYGFDKETAPVSVEATYADDSTFAFEIGDAAPSETARYVRVKGSTAVYLVENTYLEACFDGPFDYLSKSPVIAPESNQAATDTDTHTVVVRDVELSGSVRTEPLYFQFAEELLNEAGISSSPSGYIIKRPYYRAVKTGTALIDYSAYSGFTATGVEAIHPTEAQLREYGLDTPYSQVVFTLAVQRLHTETGDDGEDETTISYYNVFEYTIKLGKTAEDGSRYAVVYSENTLIPIVYRVTESLLSWATAQYDDIADTLLFYIHLSQIDRLTVTLDGVTTTFDLKRTKNEGEADGLTVTAAGKPYDAGYFRNLYGRLMSMYRAGAADGLPQGEPEMVIGLQTNTQSIPSSTIEIYRHSAAKFYVKHSGGEVYLVNSKTVEPIMQDYLNFLAGKEVTL